MFCGSTETPEISQIAVICCSCLLTRQCLELQPVSQHRARKGQKMCMPTRLSSLTFDHRGVMCPGETQIVTFPHHDKSQVVVDVSGLLVQWERGFSFYEDHQIRGSKACLIASA